MGRRNISLLYGLICFKSLQLICINYLGTVISRGLVLQLAVEHTPIVLISTLGIVNPVPCYGPNSVSTIKIDAIGSMETLNYHQTCNQPHTW